MSVNPSARSSSSATYCGAPQIDGLCSRRSTVVSGRSSAGCADRTGASAAAPARDSVVRKPRLVCVIVIGSSPVALSLQLAFEFVEETPVRAVSDNLLRARLDQTGLVEAERIEPHRVFRVVFAPFVVGDLAQSLRCVIVPVGEPASDDASRDPLRL